jgi:RNA polymerase sigma-70 factor (ECF subfamily)
VGSTTNDPADSELLVRFAGGDFAAFETFYERHRRGLFGYALGVCGDHQLAADAAQDVWLALIQGADKFARAQNPRAYLFKAVRNRAIDLGRGSSRPIGAPPVLVRPADPAAGAARAEEAARLNQALGGLPFEQREVVLLRVIGDLKFGEIAAVTGENIKTTESRYRLAMEKLKGWLAGDAP